MLKLPESSPRTAKQAKVTTSAYDPSYRLTVTGPKPYDLDLAATQALPATLEAYPITCVEGWSASASWTGPRLLDLVRRPGGSAGSRVRVVSLERGGAYGSSIVEGPHLTRAALATHLNGERIDLDHGYPVRLIAPDRPGVVPAVTAVGRLATRLITGPVTLLAFVLNHRHGQTSPGNALLEKDFLRNWLILLGVIATVAVYAARELRTRRIEK